jgi:hypothetical protein
MRVLGDLLRLNAKRFPEKKALIMDESYLTYNQLVTPDKEWTRPPVKTGPTSSFYCWFCPPVFGPTGLPAFFSEHIIC